VLQYVRTEVDDDEEAAAEEAVQLSQLSRAKELLKEKAKTFMKDMKESGMSLRIDQVNLPYGHMPPYLKTVSRGPPDSTLLLTYLVQEPKPKAALLWDSRLETLPAQ
jgi:hypothetical protein